MTTETIVVESQSTVTSTVAETNTVIQTTETPTIVVGGIVGPPGTNGVLSGSSDVDISNLQDGSTLIWDVASGKWLASKLLEKQIINAGFF